MKYGKTMPLNARQVKVTFKRRELCDLMLACSVLDEACDDASKWGLLHEKIKKMIDEFDETQEF